MLFEYAGHQRALLRTVDDFGFVTYDLVGIPRRLCEIDSLPPLVETNIDKRRAKQLPTPAAQLVKLELARGIIGFPYLQGHLRGYTLHFLLLRILSVA